MSLDNTLGRWRLAKALRIPPQAAQIAALLADRPYPASELRQVLGVTDTHLRTQLWRVRSVLPKGGIECFSTYALTPIGRHALDDLLAQQLLKEQAR
jgi:hypothetical protein